MSGIESLTPSDSLQNKDLNIARKIQIAMAPNSLPAIDGLDIGSLFIPCSAVGGDLYDIIQISKDILAFLIYDVTGYGVTSTLISAMAKVCFTKHIRNIQSPRAVIERVNMEVIRDIPADFYFTVFLAYLDLHDNKLTYSNAGHVYPIVYRKKHSTLIPLQTQGTFIGVFENGFFEEQSIYLSPGDCLILFTNGIYQLYTANANVARRQLEKDTLTVFDNGSYKDFFDTIKMKYHTLIECKPIEDDITAIAIEILTQSRKNQIKEKLGFDAGDPVYLQYVSYYEEMDGVVGIILGILDSCGYPDETIRKMKITLTELLVNAILHGNKKDFSKKVIIGHLITKVKAVISIMDEGIGFNPDILPDPTLPENLTRDSGRGLFIVKHYVDQISFNEIANRITITKKIPCTHKMSIIRIGIAGYMGAGKSTCVNILRSERTIVINADEEAKRLMHNDPAIKDALFRQYGDSIRENGDLNFSNLGKKVFKSLSDLLIFNKIIHPPLIQYLNTLVLDKKYENSGIDVMILDAALIPLWNIEGWFNRLIWVESAHQIRLKRLVKKYQGKIDSEELDRRMKLQEKLFSLPETNWLIFPNDMGIEMIGDHLKKIIFNHYTI